MGAVGGAVGALAQTSERRVGLTALAEWPNNLVATRPLQGSI